MTMMAPPPPATVTVEQLEAMDDAVSYELFDGQLVERTVSKESSRIAAKIVYLLYTEAERTSEAEVFGADLGYQCFPPESDINLRKPDASLIRKERLAPLPADFGYSPIPADLTVEVMSPNDLAVDVSEKVNEYLSAGFKLIWVVDPSTKTVMVYRGDGSTARLTAEDQITGEAALPGFKLKVKDLID